ncbi:unnamed protein product, partial [Didymodactylos carnosus]
AQELLTQDYLHASYEKLLQKLPPHRQVVLYSEKLPDEIDNFAVCINSFLLGKSSHMNMNKTIKINTRYELDLPVNILENLVSLRESFLHLSAHDYDHNDDEFFYEDRESLLDHIETTVMKLCGTNVMDDSYKCRSSRCGKRSAPLIVILQQLGDFCKSLGFSLL